MQLADRDARDLVARLGEEPQRRVEGARLDGVPPPAVVRVGLELPVVGEGRGVRVVGPALLAVPQRPHRDPVGERRRLDLAVELDEHAVRRADRPVPAPRELAAEGLVAGADDRAADHALAGEVLEHRPERLGGAGVLRMLADVEPGLRLVRGAADVPVRDERAALLDHPEVDVVVPEPLLDRGRGHIALAVACLGLDVQERRDRGGLARVRLTNHGAPSPTRRPPTTSACPGARTAASRRSRSARRPRARRDARRGGGTRRTSSA